jgi:hypothetical protein
LYHAWFLDKNNGKHGCPSLRIIFGLLSVAKVMLSVLFEEALPGKECIVPDFVFHVAGRRLEEAVAIQLINGFRLAASSLVCLRNYRDTANAFLSISHNAALEPLECVNNPKIHDPHNWPYSTKCHEGGGG